MCTNTFTVVAVEAFAHAGTSCQDTSRAPSASSRILTPAIQCFMTISLSEWVHAFETDRGNVGADTIRRETAGNQPGMRFRERGMLSITHCAGSVTLLTRR
jgi:hypothetical protein